MKIGRDDVVHVAKLAALEVPEAELPKLVEQLQGIVEFVAQLSEVPAGETAPPFIAGPPEVALREDVVRPEPLAHPPAALSADFGDGFFTVPRNAAMEGE